MSGGSGACLFCKYRGTLSCQGGQGHACSVNTGEDYHVGGGVRDMLVL